MHNATRANSGLLLFYFDLDRLKQTNDHHGHEVGSMLIKRFAELLAKSFRKSDIVARVGGDEFVVLASADAETAQDMLTRLQQRVLEDNSSGTLPVAICYSSGHAISARGQRADRPACGASRRHHVRGEASQSDGGLTWPAREKLLAAPGIQRLTCSEVRFQPGASAPR